MRYGKPIALLLRCFKGLQWSAKNEHWFPFQTLYTQWLPGQQSQLLRLDRRRQKSTLPAGRSLTSLDPALLQPDQLVLAQETARRGVVTGSMHCHLQVVTTPTVDTPGTGLLLVFDDKRYFFGQAHEGFQRVAIESSAKFVKMKEAFISGIIGTQTVGGLLGMTLTLADALKAKDASEKEQMRLKEERYHQLQLERKQAIASGAKKLPNQKMTKPPTPTPSKPSFGLHGGPNLTHTIAAARSFIFRQGVPLEVEEYSKNYELPGSQQNCEPTWSDDRIRVWALAVSPIEARDNVSSARPPSRKRSHDEYMDAASTEVSNGFTPTSVSVDGEIANYAKSNAGLTVSWNEQAVREKVVREMFMSEWRSDVLVEKPIRDVQLPAKMWIREPVSRQLIPFDGSVPNESSTPADVTVFVRQPWPGALIDHLPASSPSKTSISYIVRNHKQRGKFDADAAKALGVFGRLRADLINGEDVILNSGQIITPAMVMGPSRDGEAFAIFDIPSECHALALSQRLAYEQNGLLEGVTTFVWILGPGVSEQSTFCELVELYSDRKHFMSSPEHCPNRITMRAAAMTAAKHQYINQHRLSALQFHNEKPLLSSSPSAASKSVNNFIVARPGLKIHVQPAFKLEEEAILSPVDLQSAEKAMSDQVKRLSEEAQRKIGEVQSTSQAPHFAEAEITFLGTGSAQPSMHRNVSGTLLRIPGRGSYLFDAGENTLGQLRRKFSPAQVSEILQELRMIWISHMHADHHLGTAGVIKAWYQEAQKSGKLAAPIIRNQQNSANVLEEPGRLFVIGHPLMSRWLEEFSFVEDFGYNHLIFLSPKPAKAPNWDDCELYWNEKDVGFNTSKDSAM